MESVSVASTGAPLSVNLWLDTSGNGQFFSFDGTGKMTGLNGDTYGLGGLAPLNGSSDIGMMTAPYGSYTLAQLDSGAFSGVDSNTLAALWVGISSDPSTNSLHTDISTITVNTNQPAAVPEPSSLVSGLIGLMGMGGFAGFKRLKFARR
ncbi:MAG: hypothetical protein M1330_01210 [Armatimonadetes bacterium]|nr:hypothetical protein [Armatimonadota bacterium]